MDRQTNTTQTRSTQFISKAQASALKSAVRAAATTNPKGKDHALRCSEIGRAVCSKYGVSNVYLIPAGAFQDAMQTVYAHARPEREKGPLEARLFACKEALGDTLASMLQVKRDLAAYRHQVESLLVPLKDALGLSGRGTLEAVAQDGLGLLLDMPILQAEHELDRLHEWLAVLANRLPSIGRALDERIPPVPDGITLGAG